MDIKEVKSRYPMLSGMDDVDAARAFQQHFYPDFSEGEVAKRLGVDIQPKAAEAPPQDEGRTVLGTAKDIGITALKGAMAVPEAAVGLLDIPTGGRVGKALEDVGVRFKDANAMLDDNYSPAQKKAFKAVSDAEGVGGKFVAALQNPSTIGHSIGQAVPSMLAGGVVGRGIAALAPRIGAVGAAAAGEGITAAGSAAEQIRQGTEDGTMTAGQSGIAALSGAATGAFGLLGGKVAKSLGIADLDTAIVKASADPVVAKSLVRRTLEGALAEGVLEELPQSISEQVLQNQALGKPLDEGVDQAAVMGLLSGAAMGGGMNALHGTPKAEPGALTPEQRSAAEVAAADADAKAESAAPSWTTALGATDPNAVQPTGTASPANAPHVAEADFPTSPGAAPEYGAAIPFERSFDTDGLSLARTGPGTEADAPPVLDHEALQRSAGLSMPPQLDSQRIEDAAGLAPTQAPAVERQWDTAGLALQGEPAPQRLSERMGINPTAGPLSRAAAVAVDGGAMAHMARIAQAQAEAAQQAKDGKKPAEQEAPQSAAANASPAVDEHGVIDSPDNTGGIADWPDEQVRAQLQAAQAPEVRRALYEELGRRDVEREQLGLQDELAAELSPVANAKADDSAFAQTRVDDAMPVEAPAAPTVAQKTSVVAPADIAPAPSADILNAEGKPFAIRPAAVRAAKKAGGGYEPVKIKGGWVARKAPAAETTPQPQGAHLGPEAHQTQQAAPQPAQTGVAQAGPATAEALTHGSTSTQGPATQPAAQGQQVAPSKEEWEKAVSDARALWLKYDRGQRSMLAAQAGFGDVVFGPQKKTAATMEFEELPPNVGRAIAKRMLMPSKSAQPAKPTRKAALAKVKEARQQRADYFTPGNVVKSYGGHDRVVAYSPPDAEGRWSVTVRAVEKQGDAWVDKPGEDERVHGTQPDARELKTGPVLRAAPVSQPETKTAPQANADAAPASPQAGPQNEAAAVPKGVVFSASSTKPTQGMPVQRVQEVVDRVLDDLGIGAKSGATGDRRAQVFGNTFDAGWGAPPRGVLPTGATHEGAVYVFADNIASDAEAFKVIIHELFHLGLSKSVEQGSYIHTLLKFLSDPLVREYAQRWRLSADGVNRRSQMPVNNWHALAVEEALADISEEMHGDRKGMGTRLSAWVTRMAGRFAQLAKRMGLSGVAETIQGFSRTEAETFIQEMLRRAGGDGPVQLRGQRFSSSRTDVATGARSEEVKRVQALVDAVKARWANAPDMVVAVDLNDPVIPQSARDADQAQKSRGARGEPEGLFHDGKVYLLASQLHTAKDAVRVLFHEALGHYGLRGVFGKDLTSMLSLIAINKRVEVIAKAREYGLVGEGVDVKTADDVQVWRSMTPQMRQHAAEEVLAVMAQEAPGQPWVQRVIAAIRSWMRRNIPGFRDLRLTDAEIIRDYIVPARRFVERGAKAGQQTAPAFSRSPMKSIEANIARGREALAKALAEQTSVHRAMYRNGLGWVDFVWGAEGVVKPSGRTKGAMGLSHILEARQRKDGLGEQQAVRFLDSVVRAIASGREFDRKEVGSSMRVGLEHDNAIVWLTRRNGENAWIVTGYEKSPDGAAAGRATATPTSQAASRTRSLEAEDAGIVSDQGGNGNSPMYSRTPSAMRDLRSQVGESLNSRFNHPGTLSWWHKTLGTMYNLAEQSPAFKKVFQSAQAYIDDISQYALDAADRAPNLIPRMDDWRDAVPGLSKKKPLSTDDSTAIAAPIYQGTLDWVRDLSGKPVRLDDAKKEAEGLGVEQKAERMMKAGSIDPNMLKAWRGLPIAQFEKMVTTRFASKHLTGGVVWSDTELRSMFKLNDQQLALYREYRGAIDRSLDTTTRSDIVRVGGALLAPVRDMVMDAANIGDAMMAIDAFVKAEVAADTSKADSYADVLQQVKSRADRLAELQAKGYAPLQRFGEFTVHIAGEKEGDPSRYFGMFETKAESNAMATKLRAEYGGAVVQGTLSKEEHKLLAGITPESLEIFGDMLGLADAENGQDKVYQEFLRKAKSDQSALKRMIHRQGIVGFSEDVGRGLASFIYSNARMTSGGLHIGNIGKAVADVPKSEGQLRDAAERLRQHVLEPQENGAGVRAFMFAQYLGGSLASAAVNLTQPLTTSLPYLSQYGGATKAAQALMQASIDMANRGKAYGKDLADALERAEKAGVVSPQEIHYLMGQARGTATLVSGDGTKASELNAMRHNAWQRTKLAWGTAFGWAEQVNRRMTFIAAYRMAQANKVDNPYAFAAKAVDETQFVQNKANKMEWGRGAVGGTLMTFKGFSIAYLELMYRMWNAGAPGSRERADGRKAVMLALGALMLLGGGGGLPFLEDAEDIATGFGQMLGFNWNAKKARQEFLEKIFGRELAQFLDKGLSGVPGLPIDVSGRLGMGNLIPGTGLLQEKTSHTRDYMELLGPAGDFASRVVEGGKQMLGGAVTGDAAKAFGGAMQIAPTAVRNVAKGGDMGSSGQYKDTKGGKVSDVTTAEAIMKAIGFQPSSVAEIQEANYLRQQAKNFYNLKAQEIRALWAKGIAEKDQDIIARARAALLDWNAKNPDQPMAANLSAIIKKAREMQRDKADRIAATAPKAMRTQMKREIQEAKGALLQ